MFTPLALPDMGEGRHRHEFYVPPHGGAGQSFPAREGSGDSVTWSNCRSSAVTGFLDWGLGRAMPSPQDLSASPAISMGILDPSSEPL